jgi:hypothetical protein
MALLRPETSPCASTDGGVEQARPPPEVGLLFERPVQGRLRGAELAPCHPEQREPGLRSPAQPARLPVGFLRLGVRPAEAMKLPDPIEGIGRTFRAHRQREPLTGPLRLLEGVGPGAMERITSAR